MSFTQWLLEQRLAHARRLLEAGDAPVEVVALRQHFRARLQTSPTAYRRRFRAAAPAMAPPLAGPGSVDTAGARLKRGLRYHGP